MGQRIVLREMRQRGWFGRIVKALFVSFNVAMIAAVIAYVCLVVFGTAAGLGGMLVSIGGVLIVLTGLLFVWLIGSLLLGVLVLATRGAKVIERVVIDE